MKDDKNFEEIEIEQIDLDIDQSYDISIDVSSIGGLEYEKKEDVSKDLELDSLGDLSLKEEAEDISLGSSLDTSLDEGGSFGEKELEEGISDVGMVSISNEELDAILGGASVKEEEEEGVSIDSLVSSEIEETSEVSLEGDILGETLEMPSVESGIGETTSILETEDIFSKLESKDVSITEGLSEEMFSSAGASITSEEEIFSSKGFEESILESSEPISFEEEKKPEIVVMSTEEYNKMVEESKSIPIVEKPLEEGIEVEEETEEFEVKEKISPEEVGIGSDLQEFELKEFEEISEDMVMTKTLEDEESVEPMEVIESGIDSIGMLTEEESISMGVESDVFESVPLVEESAPVSAEEKFELVDDISIDVDISPQSQVSVMPDEVGLEEISVEPVEVSTKEEITGISFVDAGVGVESFEVKEEEPVVSAFEEVAPIETITKEEKAYKVEKAIEELTDEEKEEIKKVLLYLDKLLENLPEDKIKEFAQSEYYDIYVKLFDKLNLK